MREKIINLDIKSWQGVSPGALHFYGCLCGGKPYRKVEIKKAMTAREARELSKRDSFHYRSGSTTERFADKDELIQLAVKTYKEHFPAAKVLLLGNPVSAEPQRVLDAPPRIFKKGNKMFAEIDSMKWTGKGFLRRSEEDDGRAARLSIAFSKMLREELHDSR